MWHLTACKISAGLSFFKWKKKIFYRISELMLATLIQRYDTKSFHFKNERLNEIYRLSISFINFLNLSWITTCLFLRNMETLCMINYIIVRIKSLIQYMFCELLCSLLTSRKHAYIILTPLNPTLYSKTEVYRGNTLFFLISAQKHRLWVLVRTASPRRF